MRLRNISLVVTLALVLVAATTLRASASLAPGIGFASGAADVFTINPDGTITKTVTGDSAIDGQDDLLVNVINNSGQTIYSLALSGGGIFAFINELSPPLDGPYLPNSGGVNPVYIGSTYGAAPVGGGGLYGYEGFLDSFTVTNINSGFVNFTGGLASGGTAWFALEGDPTAAATPEPATMLLLGTGLLGMLTARKRMTV